MVQKISLISFNIRNKTSPNLHISTAQRKIGIVPRETLNQFKSCHAQAAVVLILKKKEKDREWEGERGSEKWARAADCIEWRNHFDCTLPYRLLAPQMENFALLWRVIFVRGYYGYYGLWVSP